jgi:methyltransferase
MAGDDDPVRWGLLTGDHVTGEQEIRSFRGSVSFGGRRARLRCTQFEIQSGVISALVPLGVAVFLLMILEARRSAVNERHLRQAGAVEPAGDVYQLMQVAYPACFLAMLAEAWLRGFDWRDAAMAGAALFAAAKLLKYWAIATLGGRWTFRVLVPPGSARTLRGPYRFLRHPNYVAVVGELAGFALLVRAPLAGLLAILVFGALMLARIRVEERALGLRTR